MAKYGLIFMYNFLVIMLPLPSTTDDQDLHACVVVQDVQQRGKMQLKKLQKIAIILKK